MMKVLIKGAGDLASGIAARLFLCHFEIIMTEIERPLTVRQTVSFSSAISQGKITIEGTQAIKSLNFEDAIKQAKEKKDIPVVIDPHAMIKNSWKPDVIVDGIMAKKNLGTKITDAKIVIALGPGFTAGQDCHAVIETKRGHDLGRVIYQGTALPNSGIPGEICGFGTDRLLKAPCNGLIHNVKKIGDIVKQDDMIAVVENNPINAKIDGILRGIIADGTIVSKGLKIGDIDPRCTLQNCYTISDKARSLGGGVLEAIFHLIS